MVAVKKTDLGVIDYKEAWDLQEKLFAENVNIKLEHRRQELERESIVNGQQSTESSPPQTTNHLLFCEHPHVYTLGKSGKPENLLVDEEGLKNIHAKYYKINRGGDITYHGFGQMVVYPIWDLETYFYTDIHRFLRDLEEVVIMTLADYGIEAGRVDGLTGVWIDGENPEKARKICAMGIRCSRWITMHGIALNVNTDMSYFEHIVPCGIDDKAVTSMQQELNRQIDLTEVKEKFAYRLSQVFGIDFMA
ncbi:MAG: lipoyl(octanoyl) transferase LipB [Bacteroidetes bacterium]|nr:MAG: lipoyl(octanoyl) transferase LipB [Bacteroidota bacterium]